MDTTRVRGVRLPTLGLGTWNLTGEACVETVATALEMGYRHLDTAQAYGNERQVGRGLAQSSVPRDEVFVTTKLGRDGRTYDGVWETTRASLDRLGLDRLDLLLIHWPNRFTPLAETITAMNDLRTAGLVDHVGVSNFGVRLLDRARAISRGPILTDQVQYHPYWDQRDVRTYCQIHDLALTAYSPLAQGGVTRDATLARIGDGYGKTAAQVALRWLVQQDNVIAIPKASSPAHLRDNLDVFDFELSDAEMRTILRPSKSKTAASFLRGQLPFG
jgi:diketogulonate reductase-like aldo/keto reductase